MNPNDRDDRDNESAGAVRQAEQNAFRGETPTICANAATNTPEVCGSEQPVVDAEGRPLHEPSPAVPHSAPTKH
jgi:hypothetical protein